MRGSCPRRGSRECRAIRISPLGRAAGKRRYFVSDEEEPDGLFAHPGTAGAEFPLFGYVVLGGRGRSGASSSPISPSRRQPTAASQVRAATTGDAAGVVEGIFFHPLNQTAEEHGSNPRMPSICFRQFCT